MKRIVLQPLVQLVLEHRDDCRLLLGQIVLLGGVGGEVIQFRVRSIDIVITAGLQGMKRTPAKKAKGVKRLTVGWSLRFSHAARTVLSLNLLFDLITHARQLQ